MTDRRAHDPFAPHARPVDRPAAAPREVPKGLDDMRKDDLVDLAQSWGLGTGGIRADLIEHIRAAV